MRDIITSGEWSALTEEGRLQPKPFDTLTCYFCDAGVTSTAVDERGVALPCCRHCKIYYEPQWTLDDGVLGIVLMPRTHRNEQVESNAMQQVAERAPNGKQRPQHKDVRGQVLALLGQHNRPIETAEFNAHINAPRQSISHALKKLIETGQVYQPERGRYQLINDNIKVSRG